MQKQLKPVHKVLLALVLMVFIFLGWSSFQGSNSNSNEYTEAFPGNQTPSQVLSVPPVSPPANLTRAPAAVRKVPVDEVLAGDPPQGIDAPVPGTDTGGQLTEYNKLNEEQQLSHAKNDLAERLAISIDEVHSQGLQRVIWRSSATGCPKPGRSYMQVLIPGVLIELQANGTSYRYHATTGGRPFNCPEGQAESPAPSADGAFE